MVTFWIILLCFGAYLLGACPFSVWIGRLALGKDIRKYGDGNPGATNVIKAGSRCWGAIAIICDIAKGMPFVLLGRVAFPFAQPALYIIALFAVLGHAYSPFLGFRGGKALAVFGGTLLAIPRWDVVFSFAILMFIGFLLVKNDSWTVILGAAGSLLYLLISNADMYKTLFILSVLILFVIKHYGSLLLVDHMPGRLIARVRAKKGAAAGSRRVR
jgi:acyl phosphate:glycerol-3-phosphate acyltransferase